MIISPHADILDRIHGDTRFTDELRVIPVQQTAHYRIYDQQNPIASRKQITPIIMNILENLPTGGSGHGGECKF